MSRQRIGPTPPPRRDRRGRYAPPRPQLRNGPPVLMLLFWLLVLALVVFGPGAVYGVALAAADVTVAVVGWVAAVLGAVVAVVAVLLLVGAVERRVTSRRAARRRALVADAEKWRDWSVGHGMISSAALWTTIAAHRREEAS